MDLIEFGSPKYIELDPRNLSALSNLSKQWQKKLGLNQTPLKIELLRKSTYAITARGVAGFVNVNGLQLNIIPKFLSEDELDSNWKLAMWNFFLYGKGLPIQQNSSGSIEKFNGVYDLLGDLFVRSFSRSLNRGLPLQYVRHNVVSKSMNGKLNSKYFGKLLPVTGNVNLIKTYLVDDTSVSRLIKWACSTLAASVQSRALRQRLWVLESEMPNTRSEKPLFFDRHNARRGSPHLSALIDLSLVLYNDDNIGFGQHDFSILGFLWDSHRLFESVIFRLISESNVGKDFTVKKNQQLMLTGESKKYEVYTTYPGNSDNDFEKIFQVVNSKEPTELSTIKLNLNCFVSDARVLALQNRISDYIYLKVATK